MRSLGSRRAALITGVAAVAAVALAGCSAGQVAETALKKTSNMGVNADSSKGSIAVRNLAVGYPGTEGYAAGENAPLEVGLFNKTKQPITVLISSRPAAGATENEGIVSATSVGLIGGTAARPSAPSSAAPAPSASRSAADPSASASKPASASASAAPAEPAARPARIEIAPLGAVTFLPGDAEQLVAVGLAGKLLPGQSLNLVFEFTDGSDPLELQAPVAVPLVPASRVPGEPHENTGE